MEKTKKDKLTILIDEKVKSEYKKYCDSKGLIIGKQIEIFMRNELSKIDKVENKKENRK